MVNYYRVPLTLNPDDTYNYGTPLANIVDAKMDDKRQHALIAVNNPLTIGQAVSADVFAAGFIVDNPATLPPVDFIGLLMAAGGLTQAQLNTFASDPEMAGLRLLFTAVRDGMERDNPLTTGALAQLVAANYLSASGSAGVLTNWPQNSQ